MGVCHLLLPLSSSSLVDINAWGFLIAHRLKPTGLVIAYFALNLWGLVIAHCLKPTGAHRLKPVGAFIALHLKLVRDYHRSLPQAHGGLSSLIVLMPFA